MKASEAINLSEKSLKEGQSRLNEICQKRIDDGRYDFIFHYIKSQALKGSYDLSLKIDSDRDYKVVMYLRTDMHYLGYRINVVEENKKGIKTVLITWKNYEKEN